MNRPFEDTFDLTHRMAVRPTRLIICPELYQAARNIFACLAWQEWYRTARIFGFRSTVVQTFRSPNP